MPAGNLLRAKRLQFNKTIDEISRELKVNSNYINDIENDTNYHNLTPYYYELIKSKYCKYLHLNYHLSDNNPSISKHPIQSRRNKISIYTVTIIFVSISIAIFYFFQFGRSKKPPSVTINSPISQVFEDANRDYYEIYFTTTNPKIDLSGNVASQIKVFINNNQINVDKIGDFILKDKILFSGENLFQIVAQNQSGNKNTILIRINYQN